jgi:ABC-type multidrug transport system fused ATPase/permease subunit
MQLIKKLLFGVIWLIVTVWELLLIKSLLLNPQPIVGFDVDSLISFLILGLALIINGSLLGIFVALADDWKLVLPVILCSAICGYAVTVGGGTESITVSVGLLIIGVLAFLVFKQSLKSYLNFDAAKILSGGLKMYVFGLIFVISLSYFMLAKIRVENEGFSLPDSLIDSVISMVPKDTQSVENTSLSGLQISPDQIELLKNNPETLQKMGINPAMLDSIGGQNTTSDDLVKLSVKSQLDKMIEPYIDWIPLFLAISLFFTLTTISSLIMFCGLIFIWIVFYLLEKSGFISFNKEMREIRKLVV